MYLDIDKAEGDIAGYSRTAVIKGLEIATERACRRYFRTSRCYCDYSNRVVTIDFVIPKDRAALNQIRDIYGINYDAYDQMVPVTLPIDSLPKRIQKMTEQDLSAAVSACQEKENYYKWKKRVNTIVEGVVVYDTDSKSIEVDVNGTTCLLPRRYWISEEAQFLYRRGKTAIYHIIRVEFDDTECVVTLSRRSLILPALLLKANMPAYQFECTKRFPGRKSWVKTNAPLSDKNFIEARKAVSLELSGEVIETTN